LEYARCEGVPPPERVFTAWLPSFFFFSLPHYFGSLPSSLSSLYCSRRETHQLPLRVGFFQAYTFDPSPFFLTLCLSSLMLPLPSSDTVLVDAGTFKSTPVCLGPIFFSATVSPCVETSYPLRLQSNWYLSQYCSRLVLASPLCRLFPASRVPPFFSAMWARSQSGRVVMRLPSLP